MSGGHASLINSPASDKLGNENLFFFLVFFSVLNSFSSPSLSLPIFQQSTITLSPVKTFSPKRAH